MLKQGERGHYQTDKPTKTMSRARKTAAIIIAGIFATISGGLPARAAFIVGQPATADSGLVSSLYIETPGDSLLEIDDFATPAVYQLGVLTAFVERNSPADGIWYWNTSFTGSQAPTWAIGTGQPPAPEIDTFTTHPLALAYTLTGDAATFVPEPPTGALLLGAIGIGMAAIRRPRSRAQQRRQVQNVWVRL